MQKHEYFEELAALALAGQVTAEEYAELREHLRACESCRRATEQFEMILEQLPMPEVAAKDAALQDLQSESYRKRFMRRAAAEGVRFSSDVRCLQNKPPRSRFEWRPFSYGVASAIAAVVLVWAVVGPFFTSRPTPSQPVPAPNVTAAADIAPKMTTTLTPVETNRVQPSATVLESRLENAQRDLALQLAEKQWLAEELETWKSQAAQLEVANRQSGQKLAGAETRVQQLEQESTQLTASLIEQQARIQGLSNQVQAQKAATERERQLSAAARDVREMMGARSLHIIDVADLNGNGVPRKSFGRVFFSEGKLLVFYAFDLSQKRSAANVAFQAWGQGTKAHVRNLGVFHIDDQAQKRWVLRVDNPALLNGVESVFVTIEPAPGKESPSGPQLLYAYLGSVANHP